LNKPSKKTSALTYDLYCFKHHKITLLWQKPTIEKKINAGFFFFSFQKNTSLNLKYLHVIQFINLKKIGHQVNATNYR